MSLKSNCTDATVATAAAQSTLDGLNSAFAATLNSNIKGNLEIEIKAATIALDVAKAAEVSAYGSFWGDALTSKLAEIAPLLVDAGAMLRLRGGCGFDPIAACVEKLTTSGGVTLTAVHAAETTLFNSEFGS